MEVDRAGWWAMLLVPLGVADRQTEADIQPRSEISEDTGPDLVKSVCKE